MAHTYRVRQFAELAGVTVKTLHHYDRLGLLKPQRTSSGYRTYSDRDLARLEQITALKLIAPLKEIGALLRGDRRPLGDILESQKRVLRARRAVLDRAILAIEDAQRSRAAATATDVDVLRTLIEAIGMQDATDVLKVYFDDDVWLRWRAQHAEWPGPEWRALLSETEDALDIDPTSEKAGELAERWNGLMKRDAGGDVAVRVGFMKAWREWLIHPEKRPPQFAAFDMDRILPFIVNAADAEHERRRIGSPETAPVPPRVGSSRMALFHDVADALGSDPAGETGQQFARRLGALLDAEAGDDVALKAEMLESWKRCRAWPAGVLRWVASTYDMKPDTWVAVSEYLRRAMA